MIARASDISVFDILRVGIGPSSSHTVGPMLAARRFREMIERHGASPEMSLRVELLGSLAATGKGHRTDEAVCAGLMGLDPADTPMAEIWGAMDEIRRAGGVRISGASIAFMPERDITWQAVPPPEQPLRHPNTLRFIAAGPTASRPIELTARSVGGGFVEYDGDAGPLVDEQAAEVRVSYPFDTAAELVELCGGQGRTMVEVALANELARGMTEPQVRDGLLDRWRIMREAIDAGLSTDGVLPGGLNVPRRAGRLYRHSLSERLPLARHADLRTSAYAMAVGEHNAAGGRIVTAPTNGAAGVLPAALHEVAREQNLPVTAILDGLLVAGLVAAIVKRGASLSGAEVGCQGEIGTASAMAAAATVAMLRGDARQIEAAAEIAIEHHLGLTCDPVGGLVQIPCIERNAMGAIKALNAAAMALASDGNHLVSLDRAVRVMKQTGHDLQAKYRETATGGLAGAFGSAECA